MAVATVIPTYNEADNIEAVCRQVRAAVPDGLIVVVDDDSPDGTGELARRIAAEVGSLEVLSGGPKAGLGAAYRRGFAHAIASGAEIVVQLDADLSHDPAMIVPLVVNVEMGADLAIGSRYVPGGRTIDWPWQRRALSRWGNRYAAGALGLAINDATSGFRAYRVAALERIGYETVSADGYGFQVEMTHRLVRRGGRIVEVPIEFRDRVAGESKLDKDIIGEAFTLVARLWREDLAGRRQRRRQGR